MVAAMATAAPGPRPSGAGTSACSGRSPDVLLLALQPLLAAAPRAGRAAAPHSGHVGAHGRRGRAVGVAGRCGRESDPQRRERRNSRAHDRGAGAQRSEHERIGAGRLAPRSAARPFRLDRRVGVGPVEASRSSPAHAVVLVPERRIEHLEEDVVRRESPVEWPTTRSPGFACIVASPGFMASSSLADLTARPCRRGRGRASAKAR